MMNYSSQAETLRRIQSALEAARDVLSRFTSGAIEAEYKAGHDPVTAADTAVDVVLRETASSWRRGRLSRLQKKQVWVVDPLDGTREFVAGIPEFCVSIAMVETAPLAGGICNPATHEICLGSLERGITYNGKPARPSQKTTLEGALILASRSEVQRGEWKQFEHAASVFALWARRVQANSGSLPDWPTPRLRSLPRTSGMSPPGLFCS